jgi:large repetitive protein
MFLNPVSGQAVMRRILGYCVWLALALAAAGCGGSQGAASSQPAAASQPGAGAAFGMPAPAGVMQKLAPLRAASGALLDLAGKDFDPASAQRLTAQGPDAVFEPAWTSNASPHTDFACAVYRFNLQGYTGPQTLQLTWSSPPEDYGNLWLGLSNWDDGHWDWQPGPDNGVLLPLGGLTQYTAQATGDLLVAVVMLGTAPCALSELRIGGSLAGGWRMFGHDAQHTHRSEAVSSQTGKLKWKYRTTGPGFAFTNTALNPDGTVYAGAADALHAYSPDGVELWECPIPEAGTPVYNGHGLIYTATRKGYVYAVTTAGAVAWRFGAGTQALTDPVVGPTGECYVGTNDGYVYARGADGHELWTYATGSTVKAGPVLANDGALYVGCLDNKVYSLRTDGSLNWTYALAASNAIGCCSVGPDGTLYVTSYNGLLALNQTGVLKWQHTQEHAYAYPAPAFGLDGTLYFDNGEGALIALTPENEQLWRYPTNYAYFSNPIVGSNGLIYYSTGKTIYAIDSSTKAQWSYTTEYNIHTPQFRPDYGMYFTAGGYLISLNSAGDMEWRVGCGGPAYNAVFDKAGTAYIYSGGGSLYAFHPDGTLKWNYEPGGSSTCTSAVGHDGTVYFGNSDSVAAVHDDGSVKWKFTGDQYFYDGPALDAADNIFIGGGSHGAYLYSINQIGKQNWSAYVTGEITCSSPALATDGTVYISGVPGIFAAYNPPAEWCTWVIDIDWTYESSPAVGEDNTVYIGANSDTYDLLAINPDSSQKWVFHPGGYIDSSPALGADDTIYFNCKDGLMYAINPNGTLLWTAVAGGQSSPAIGADGVVYAGGLDNCLHAISPDGNELWQSQPAGGEFSDPAIADDGTLVVGCADGWIRAYGD